MGKNRSGEGMTAWETEENLAKIEEWAGKGLMLADIAHNMGISRPTLYNWREKSPAITAALKRGGDVADERVENALYRAACEGNITAQIFYLKNRKPFYWRDKRETEIAGSGKVSFEWDAKQGDKSEAKTE